VVQVVDLRLFVASMGLAELLAQLQSVVALFDVVVESADF